MSSVQMPWLSCVPWAIAMCCQNRIPLGETGLLKTRSKMGVMVQKPTLSRMESWKEPSLNRIMSSGPIFHISNEVFVLHITEFSKGEYIC